MTNNIYGRIDAVLEDLRRTITDERAGTHGDPELFVKVFSGMVRSYIDGILQTERGLQDLDGFVLLSLMKIARQSVGGPVPFYDHALDAAGYQVLKAAATRPEPSQPVKPEEPEADPDAVPEGAPAPLEPEPETTQKPLIGPGPWPSEGTPADVVLQAMAERTRALRGGRGKGDNVG